MIVRINNSFAKDINKISDRILLKKIVKHIENFQKIEDYRSLANIKKLKLSKNSFRIKIGEYRLGIIIEDDIVEFVRCLHRRDIYRYFPK